MADRWPMGDGRHAASGMRHGYGWLSTGMGMGVGMWIGPVYVHT
jgi:hypothetical protein